MRKSDVAVMILIAVYLVKFASGMVSPTSYEGMTAIAIVENFDADADILENLAGLKDAATARGLDSRQYDDDQESAVRLLEMSGAKSPVLLIYDGSRVVKSFPLPTPYSELGPVLQ